MLSYKSLIHWTLTISATVTSIIAVGMPAVAQKQPQPGQSGQYQWNLPGQPGQYKPGQNPSAPSDQYLCYGGEPGALPSRDLSQAPAQLRQAAMQALAAQKISIQSNTFISYNTEEEDSTLVYEFQAYQQGSYCGVEVDVTEQGQAVEIELEIVPSELPQAVQRAIQQQFPQSFVYYFVERSLRLDGQKVTDVVYEVEIQAQGKIFEAEITPEGKILSLEEGEGQLDLAR